MQTVVLNSNINRVFEKLGHLCACYEFTIRAINHEKKIIRAKKGTMFSATELQLNISETDNQLLKIQVSILKKGAPQLILEEKFVDSIYIYFYQSTLE